MSLKSDTIVYKGRWWVEFIVKGQGSESSMELVEWSTSVHGVNILWSCVMHGWGVFLLP